MSRFWSIVIILFAITSSVAQNPTRTDDPFSPVVDGGDGSPKVDQPISGSVEYNFDGGSLRCTFGVLNRSATPHIAILVFPTSVDAMAKRIGVPIVRRGEVAVVIVSADGKKFVQLTSTSVTAWSKARIAEMSGRTTSVAENAFVSAVVHALSNELPVSLWASEAQDSLEAGKWCRLFDSKLAAAKKVPVKDLFQTHR